MILGVVDKRETSGHRWRLAGVIVAMMWLGPAACGEDGATPVPVPLESSRSVSFTTQDGVEITGRPFGEGQTGVVLSHMYPADQSSWWEFGQSLAESGYMALTFDFRGYGDSGGRKDIEVIDRDVEAAMEYLRAEGASRIFLAGASMGGTASLKVAARHNVAGVVSLSAPLEFRGMSVKGERIRVPVLLIVTDGDGSAMNSLERMIEEGVVGGPELTSGMVYSGSNKHGTDILKGDDAVASAARILAFLESHGR